MKKQPKAAAAIRAEKATGKQPTAASQLPNLEDLVRFLATAQQDPKAQARVLEQMIATAAQQAEKLGVTEFEFLVGQRNCSIQARNNSPSMGPSATMGAVRRWWRRPATKVVVCQSPRGAEATHRQPLGARP